LAHIDTKVLHFQIVCFAERRSGSNSSLASNRDRAAASALRRAAGRSAARPCSSPARDRVVAEHAANVVYKLGADLFFIVVLIKPGAIARQLSLVALVNIRDRQCRGPPALRRTVSQILNGIADLYVTLIRDRVPSVFAEDGVSLMDGPMYAVSNRGTLK
jgi:hypothetical protein